MRAFIASGLIFFVPLTTFAALTTGPVEPVSGLIKIPEVQIDPSYLAPMEAGEAVGLNVPGMTGGLTHPACVAETARRAAMDPPQPPPNGDFPCVVPASNGAGVVNGVCFVKVCKGVSSTGLDGLLSALGGLSSLSSMVSSVLSNLLKPQPGSPSGDGGNPGANADSQPTPPPLSSGLAQPINTSKLLSDSADIVRNLLSLLNPSAGQNQ